jgi:spore coat polysaccharide biosynthesis protein SpsF
VEANIQDPPVREHVSLYFYEHPEKYKTIYMLAPKRFEGHEIRLMLDYPEDLKFIREVYTELLEKFPKNDFDLPELFDLFKRRPELLDINRNCVVKKVR